MASFLFLPLALIHLVDDLKRHSDEQYITAGHCHNPIIEWRAASSAPLQQKFFLKWIEHRDWK